MAAKPNQFRRQTDGKLVPHVEIEGKLADEYLAYASLGMDLTLALRLIDELAKWPAPEDPEEDWVRLGLWSAIVNAYARCFGIGRRQAYSKIARPHPRLLAPLHDWLLTHRNTYVAHLDVGTVDERGAVVAMLAPDGEPPEVKDVTHFSQRWLMPEPKTLKRVRELVVQMRLQFTLREHDVQGRLLHAARDPCRLKRIYHTAESDGAITINKDRPGRPPPEVS